MAVTSYVAPTSWTDKGMNWDDPDPGNMDYIMAILLALRERLELAGDSNSILNVNYLLRGVMPYAPMCRFQKYYNGYTYLADRIREVLWDICAAYVNREKMEAVESYYDPEEIRMTWSDVVKAFPDVANQPFCGSCQDRYKDFLKACKGALDMLHILPSGAKRFPTASKVSYAPIVNYNHSAKDGSSGGWKDDGDAAYSSAVQNLSADTPSEHEGEHYSEWEIAEVYSKTRISKAKSSGRCQAYVNAQILEIQNLVLSQKPCELIFLVQASKPTEPDSATTANVFDPVNTGFSEGLNRIRMQPSDLPVRFGSFEQLPTPCDPPISESYSTTYGYSGYSAKIYLILDYGVSGGLKFFASS